MLKERLNKCSDWIHTDSFYHLAISVILTSGFFLRIIYMTGPIGSDDVYYLDYAEKFTNFEQVTDVIHFADRTLFIFLTGIPYKIGGHAIYAAYANVFYSLLVDLVATLFAWFSIGRRSALIVASIMAFHPLHINYSGSVLPDTTITLFFLLAAILLYRTVSYRSFAHQRIGLFLSGMLGGAAYMCKEPGILFFPPACLYLFFLNKQEPSIRRRCFSIAWLVGGLVFVLIFDGFANYFLTDRIKYISTHLAENDDGALPIRLSSFIHIGLFHCKRALLFDWRWMTWQVHIGGIAAILTLCRRNEMAIFSLIILFTLFYLLLGTGSLRELAPLYYQPRYFVILVPFSAILFAYLLQSISMTGWTLMRLGIPLVIVIFTVSTGMPAVRQTAGIQYHAKDMKPVATAIELLKDEDKDFYVEPSVYEKVKYFLPTPLFQKVKQIPENGILPNGLYIIHSNPKLRTDSQDKQRIKIERFSSRLRVSLDYRIVNRFRDDKDYESSPPVFVYDNTSNL